MFRYIVVAILLVAVGEATAQRMPERGLVRRGNRQFKREHFEKSTDLYQRALQHDSTSFEAKYDLASAMYRTERYDSAEQLLRSIVQDTTRTERERGEVAYNLGNTQFAQQKYKEALSSYRYAMRCNPDDEDAKFNYAFTKRLVQQQEQQQNQDNKEQNQDKQDQQGQQDKNEQNKQQQEQQQEQQQPQNQEEKEGEGQQQPREGAMSPEQQEAMLQAIQAEEDKTQEKLKEKAGVIIRGSKSW
ncbi:MAG: tetratricopeptide repeat protein [Rikenellaceae bacterium]|nr:tetratricopeptide repeat protein [Rikenellaceae bacterium]